MKISEMSIWAVDKPNNERSAAGVTFSKSAPEPEAITIKCRDCKFAKVDERASEGSWKAYECGNCKSEYHRALLNVTTQGAKQARITWVGCVNGERREIACQANSAKRRKQ